MAFVLAFALSGFTPSVLAFAEDGNENKSDQPASGVETLVEAPTSYTVPADDQVQGDRETARESAGSDAAASGLADVSSTSGDVSGQDATGGSKSDSKSSDGQSTGLLGGDAANSTRVPGGALAEEIGKNREANPASLTELWVDGAAGDDINNGGTEGTALKTLTKALELQDANPAIATIYLKGTFEKLPTTTIPSGVKLVIAANTTMTGSGNDGIKLESGSTLKCENGATLSMSGFGTALTVPAGA